MDSLVRRWTSLESRTRQLITLGAIVVLFAIAYNIPGLGPQVRERAPLGYIVLGIVHGSVIALFAMGLILIYRTSRFINFAYGALGSMVGVLAVGLYLHNGWPFWLVVPLGTIAGILVGGLTEVLLIRRFRNASRLVLTVASIGLAQFFGGLELLGSNALGFISLQGQFNIDVGIDFHVGFVPFGGPEVLIMLTVPLVILVIAYFLLRTDAGIAVRAAAENADRALLLGIPIRRLTTIVWALAGGLAALTFILKSPFAGITPGVASNGPTALLPALAAAVIARMESLPRAFFAGLGIGIAGDIVTRTANLGSTPYYLRTPATYDLILLIVILVALLAQRGVLSRAQEIGAATWQAVATVKPVPNELKHLPEVRWVKAAVLLVTSLAFVFIPYTWSSSNQLLAGFAMVWAMAGVSLVILTGWGGHISLGQFGIVGVGGLVTGNLVSRWNFDLFLILILAGLAGGLVALIVGMPALRIKGPFLAVTTMALAIALNSYAFNVNLFDDYLPRITRPYIWERFNLDQRGDNYVMYLLCLAMFALSVLATLGVRKARAGRVVIATRDNQRAADSAAVPTTGIKLSAFILAGVISGIAGGLYDLLLTTLGQGTFGPEMSIYVFSYAVIGGLGSITGAVLGVLAFRFVETINALGDFQLILSGAGLFFVLLALPGGLGQLVFGVRDRYLRWVADRRGIIVPSLTQDRRSDKERHAADEVDLLRGALGGTAPVAGR